VGQGVGCRLFGCRIFSQHRTVKPPTQKEADILQIVEKEAEFEPPREVAPTQPPAETA